PTRRSSDLCIRSSVLRINRKEPCVYDKMIIQKAIQIGVPMGFEHIAVCGAMIVSTRIVSPLGTIAIAANSFAVTAESLCYMPGYGIAAAATAIVGQSLGAGKKRLAKNFSNISILMGCVVMTVAGIVMYFLCPVIFQILTPDIHQIYRCRIWQRRYCELSYLRNHCMQWQSWLQEH